MYIVLDCKLVSRVILQVLIILSLGFISSQWCLYEFQCTNALAFEGKKSKLILFSKESIPKQKLPPTLAKMLETRTYIEWTDDSSKREQVWEKLRNVCVAAERKSSISQSQRNENIIINYKYNITENGATEEDISKIKNVYLSNSGVLNPSFSPLIVNPDDSDSALNSTSVTPSGTQPQRSKCISIDTF